MMATVASDLKLHERDTATGPEESRGCQILPYDPSNFRWSSIPSKRNFLQVAIL